MRALYHENILVIDLQMSYFFIRKEKAFDNL
jgi:hypothetical protein